MARHRHRTPQIGGTLVLDAHGVTQAASNDQQVQAFLTAARARDARVVVSTITLTEVLRAGPRDTDIHRVLNRVSHIPLTPTLARAAGELLGATGLNDATTAAVIAATALSQPGPLVILTSDPRHLRRLTARHPTVVQKV